MCCVSVVHSRMKKHDKFTFLLFKMQGYLHFINLPKERLNHSIRDVVQLLLLYFKIKRFL